MDIERTKTYVRQICLATSLTHIIVLSINITCSSWWLVAIFKIFIWELVLWVKNLILMHYPRALFKILNCFFILLAINVEHRSIKIKVFLIEDIFFVIVGILLTLFFVLRTSLVKFIRFVSIEFSIQFFKLSIVKFTDVFIVIFLFFTIFIILLNSKS